MEISCCVCGQSGGTNYIQLDGRWYCYTHYQAAFEEYKKEQERRENAKKR